jgi:hypothetical protein
MSKLVVRIFSSLLLVVFLGFLVPINSWHTYTHAHSFKHERSRTDGLKFKQGVEKCAFCDLQLPLLFHEDDSFSPNWKIPFDFLFIDYNCSELPVEEALLSLRGPPYNADLF